MTTTASSARPTSSFAEARAASRTSRSLSLDPRRRSRFALRPLKHPRLVVWCRTKWRITAALRNNPDKSCLFSSELLSYLRRSDEIDRLKALFPARCQFSVVVCLRRPNDYLVSYANYLARKKIVTSSHQGDFNYVESDSWLADYEGLIGAYRRLTDDIRRIDYDAAMARHGNMVPALCQSIGVDRSSFDPHDLPFLNQSAHRAEGAHDRGGRLVAPAAAMD